MQIILRKNGSIHLWWKVNNWRPWLCGQLRQSNSLLLRVRVFIPVFPWAMCSCPLHWPSCVTRVFLSLTWQETLQLFASLVSCCVRELKWLSELWQACTTQRWAAGLCGLGQGKDEPQGVSSLSGSCWQLTEVPVSPRTASWLAHGKLKYISKTQYPTEVSELQVYVNISIFSFPPEFFSLAKLEWIFIGRKCSSVGKKIDGLLLKGRVLVLEGIHFFFALQLLSDYTVRQFVLWFNPSWQLRATQLLVPCWPQGDGEENWGKK